MQQYLNLVWHVLNEGTPREDRTGIGTLSEFGCQVGFNLLNGFPAVTVKRLAFGQVAGELLCFIHGKRNLNDFHELGVKIWDANGTATYWTPEEPGDLGRIYGVQWRDWQGAESSVDQLSNLIEGLKADPYSRRHIVTAWQPAELGQMCLPPCHILFQCYVSGEYLDMRVDMRSLDLFLGFPFDIASYAILQTLLAKEAGLTARKLIFQIGDAHIYKNHIPQVKEMLAREPKDLPTLWVNPNKGIFEMTMDDIVLENYRPDPAIKAEMNV